MVRTHLRSYFKIALQCDIIICAAGCKIVMVLSSTQSPAQFMYLKNLITKRTNTTVYAIITRNIR